MSFCYSVTWLHVHVHRTFRLTVHFIVIIIVAANSTSFILMLSKMQKFKYVAHHETQMIIIVMTLTDTLANTPFRVNDHVIKNVMPQKHSTQFLEMNMDLIAFAVHLR